MSGNFSQLRKLSDEVCSRLAAVGTTSNSVRVRFEGGDYQKLYLKPNYKLGSALLTSRELLVVVSPSMNNKLVHLRPPSPGFKRLGVDSSPRSCWSFTSTLPVTSA